MQAGVIPGLWMWTVYISWNIFGLNLIVLSASHDGDDCKCFNISLSPKTIIFSWSSFPVPCTKKSSSGTSKFRLAGSGKWIKPFFSHPLRNFEETGSGGQCQLNWLFVRDFQQCWCNWNCGGGNFTYFFDIFRDLSRANFSRTDIVIVVPSNRNQLLATCDCNGSAAECLIWGKIPGWS